jgi:hypothetical protein
MKNKLTVIYCNHHQKPIYERIIDDISDKEITELWLQSKPFCKGIDVFMYGKETVFKIYEPDFTDKELDKIRIIVFAMFGIDSSHLIPETDKIPITNDEIRKLFNPELTDIFKAMLSDKGYDIICIELDIKMNNLKQKVRIIYGICDLNELGLISHSRPSIVLFNHDKHLFDTQHCPHCDKDF